MAKRQLQPDPRPIPRCMLYNEHGSKIFVGEDVIADALDDGWSDTPVELAQPPEGDVDLVSANQELNAALAKQHDEQAAAKKQARELQAEVKAQSDRADAAEAENKKLAAALKKAKAGARK